MTSFQGKQKILSYTTNSSQLRHVQSGNSAAWQEFYQKYSGMIHFIGRKRCLSPEECDDLMVDVMTIFWHKMDAFIYDRSKGRLRSYLGQIANYCAMQIFCGRQRNTVPFDPAMEYPEDVDKSMLEEWRNFLLEQAMNTLRQNVDTETYQVFYMSFVQKCPVAEIASVTRKSPNNIYVIRSRCMTKLKKIISQYRQLDEAELLDHSSKKASES